VQKIVKIYGLAIFAPFIVALTIMSLIFIGEMSHS